MLIYRTISTPVGELQLVATPTALRELRLPPLDDPRTDDVPCAVLDEAQRQIEEYFRGERREFDLPLDPQGTDFQRAVWDALQTIPFGETASYVDIARQVGSPKGSRAVGQANGRNPISIIIPCHRVIAADKSLGGYGGGLPLKTWLLTHES